MRLRRIDSMLVRSGLRLAILLHMEPETHCLNTVERGEELVDRWPCELLRRLVKTPRVLLPSELLPTEASSSLEDHVWSIMQSLSLCWLAFEEVEVWLA
jgi:hypothetical protein